MAVLTAVSLLYDSDRASRSTNERAGFALSRVLVFQEGDVSVDLVSQAGCGDLQIYQGQIVRRGFAGPVQGALVRLGAEAEPTTTDAFGQFAVSSLASQAQQILEFEFEGRTLQLIIPAPQDSDTN